MSSCLGWTPLHYAAFRGNEKEVRRWMKVVSVNRESERVYDTPFLLAFQAGHDSIVELMLSQKTKKKKWLFRHFNEINYKKPEDRTEEELHIPMVGYSVLDACIRTYPKHKALLVALIANGARLDTVWPRASRYITDEIRDMERGVRNCRQLTILIYKLTRNKALALAVWVTRTDEAWY